MIKTILTLTLSIFTFIAFAQKTLDSRNISAWSGSWSQVAEEDYEYFLNGDSTVITQNNISSGNPIMVRQEFIREDAQGRVKTYEVHSYDQNEMAVIPQTKIHNTYATTVVGSSTVDFLFRIVSYTWNKNTQHWDTGFVEVSEVNNDGLVSSKTTYEGGMTLKYSKFDIVYNSKGDIDTQYVYVWSSNNWALNARTHYHYNGSDQLTHEITDYWNPSGGVYLTYLRYDYGYNADGKRDSIVTSQWSQASQAWFPNNRTQITYDNDGDTDYEINQIYAGSGNWTNQFKFDYIYQTTNSLPNLPIADFRIFPVPANNHLNIQSNMAVSTVEVYDMNGQLVKKVNSLENLNPQIPTYDIEGGIYFLKLKFHSGQVESRKIVVRH
ncbi:T9SS type A sorting domain-containing protein [bacterium]|nr:T9SS type A sorting domain-containing protein [bacterium]